MRISDWSSDVCSSDLLVEHLVETVEQALVLHIDGAGEVIELLGAAVDHLAVERLQQHQMLFQSGGAARRAQLVAKAEKHGCWPIASCRPAQQHKVKGKREAGSPPIDPALTIIRHVRPVVLMWVSTGI